MVTFAILDLMYERMNMRERNSLDVRYTWDLEKIYDDISLFEKDYLKVKKLITELSDHEDKMMNDAENFYESIRLSYEIERLLDKLSVYASLSFDLDTSDNDKQELSERVNNLKSDYLKKSYFIVPNILKCDYSVIEKYYEVFPKLKEYEISLKNIYRYKKHTLSDSEEKVLSSFNRILGKCYETYELFKDCDMSFGKILDEDGNEVQLTNSSYSLYIESRSRKVRKKAFDTLYGEYQKYSNTYASLLATNMKELSTLAKIKKYKSAIEMSLFADDVPMEVYDNLISTVHKNIGFLYDYYRLKKDVLGLKELHMYDIYVPIVDNFDKKYDYEEAKDIVIKVLSIFGDEYIEKVKEAFENRWIDVYPTKNKRTGGYSGGSYDTYPYILLNYQDKYSDMSTLIHEIGHSMHSYYSRGNNSYQNSEYRIFVAEVASTVNELLLSYYMLDNSDCKEQKLSILNGLMELYKATIYRQTMFAEFEKIISDKCDKDEPLTASKLSSIYYDLNKFYFGADVVVDDNIRYEWEKVPHFYYNFYVYKYATGLSAATSIVKRLFSKEKGATENYIEFLKCGSSRSPLDSLKLAGVDLRDSQVVQDALDEFKNIIEMYKENI